MEEAYRASGVRTILLRAGDFIDTRASGNWFERIMIKPLRKGRFVYPGDPCVLHAWACLQDLARAAVSLVERRHELPRFADVPFAGFALSGNLLAQSLSGVMDGTVSLHRMRWWPLVLARLIWPMAVSLLEKRFLWNSPHSPDSAFFRDLLPAFMESRFERALAAAVPASSLHAVSKVSSTQPAS